MNRRDFLKRSALAAGALAFEGMWRPARAAFPKLLIYDDDEGPDCDGTADLFMLCQLARSHDITLLAYMSCIQSGSTFVGGSPFYFTGAGYACPVSRAIIDYCQVPGVLYGKYTGNAVKGGGANDIFGASLSGQFRKGETDSAYTTSSLVQTQNVLTNAPDASVTYLASGFGNTMADLMRASGGPALIQAKMREFIWVAGTMPSGLEQWNVLNNVPDASYICDNWNNGWGTQVPMTWCGVEMGDTNTLYNRPPPGDSETVNPVKWAFNHGTTGGGVPATYRNAWSIPGILHMVWPGVYTSFGGVNGKVTVTGTGFPSTCTTTFSTGTNRGMRYLQLAVPASTINALMVPLMNSPVGPFPSAIYLQNNLKTSIGIKVP